jgi:NADH-quinone oxidoreductase subunit A
MYLTGYSLVLLLLLFSGLTPFLLMAVSAVVRTQYKSRLKSSVYESGMAPFGDSHVQFDVKFYMYALLFILFDIETVFMYPWAVAFDNLVRVSGWFPIVEMFIFIVILMLGLVYAWRRDALKWQ